METPQYSSWREAYQEALLEADPERLQEKVQAAENAIFLRMQELAGRPNPSLENAAIQEAIKTIRSIQIKSLNYPKLPNEPPVTDGQ